MDYLSLIYLIGITVIIVIGSVLLYYLIFQFSLIFRGISQYEYMFNIDLKEEKYFSLINNKTKYEKFTEIFGTNPLFWLIPISKYIFKI